MNFKTIISINKLQKYLPIELLLKVSVFIYDPYLLLFYKQQKQILGYMKSMQSLLLVKNFKKKTIVQNLLHDLFSYTIKSNNRWFINVLITNKISLVDSSMLQIAMKENKLDLVQIFFENKNVINENFNSGSKKRISEKRLINYAIDTNNKVLFEFGLGLFKQENKIRLNMDEYKRSRNKNSYMVIDYYIKDYTREKLVDLWYSCRTKEMYNFLLTKDTNKVINELLLLNTHRVFNNITGESILLQSKDNLGLCFLRNIHSDFIFTRSELQHCVALKNKIKIIKVDFHHVYLINQDYSSFIMVPTMQLHTSDYDGLKSGEIGDCENPSIWINEDLLDCLIESKRILLKFEKIHITIMKSREKNKYYRFRFFKTDL
jgi:hypothetical protein